MRYFRPLIQSLREEEERTGALMTIDDAVLGVPKYAPSPLDPIAKLALKLTFREMRIWAEELIGSGVVIRDEFDLAILMDDWAHMRSGNNADA